SPPVPGEISRVGVVGLGTMGAGIAQVCLQGGVEVVGREVSTELGEQAAGRIGHFLTRAVEKGRIEQAERDAAMARLRLTTELTADDVFEAAYAFAERVGKTPIRCHDTPGFVVNRVLIPLLNDCVRVLDEARITPEDLDKGMKHGAGWPLGPCELLDLIGIDVHVHAAEALYAALREPRDRKSTRLNSSHQI